jgi:hypothetical protein
MTHLGYFSDLDTVSFSNMIKSITLSVWPQIVSLPGPFIIGYSIKESNSRCSKEISTQHSLIPMLTSMSKWKEGTHYCKEAQMDHGGEHCLPEMWCGILSYDIIGKYSVLTVYIRCDGELANSHQSYQLLHNFPESCGNH